MGNSLSSINIGFNVNLKQFQTQMQQVSSEMKRVGGQMQQMGKTMSTYLTAPLVAFAGVSAHLWDVQEQAIAQVRQGIQTTGGAAGKTLEELQALASQMQDKSLYGDEAILKDVTAQLLTFTSITGEQFDRTQQAALDLATRLGGDLKSASIQLGKALNDPAKNLSALSRSGIQFTASQKDMIYSLWAAGDAAQAQSIILEELERQYGGSAQAAAEAGLGPLKQLKNSWGDFMEQIGEVIGKAILPLVDKLKHVVKWLQDLSPEVKKVIVIVGGLVAAIGPALLALGTMAKMLSGLALVATPVGAAFAGIALAVGAAVALIIANWEPIKAYFTTGPGAEMWMQLKEIVAGVFESIQTIVGKGVELVKAIWARFGGDISAMAGMQFKGLLNTVQSAMQIIGDIFSTISYFIQGDWDNMWKSLKNIFVTFINWMISSMATFAKVLLYPIERIASAMGKDGLASKLQEVQQAIDFYADKLMLARYETDEAEKSTINLSESVGELATQVAQIDPVPIQEVTEALREAEALINLNAKGFDVTKGASVMPKIKTDQVQVVPLKIEEYKDEMQFLQDRMQAIGGELSSLFDESISGIIDGTYEMDNAFQDFFKNLQTQLIQAISKFLVLKAVSGIFGLASGGTTGFFGSMFGVPALATGGIVTGPTLAMVGEGGESEVVMPLSELYKTLKYYGGAGHVQVSGEFRLSGDTAAAIIERNNYKNSR